MSSSARKQHTPKAPPKRLRIAMKRVGYVDIDSGTIMIADPCHAVATLSKARNELNRAINKATGEPGEPPHIGKFCAGVAAPSAGGDGRFPVYAALLTGSKRPRYLLIDMDDMTSPITITRVAT